MCREFHDFSHEVSPNMMKIDRDHPPEPPHVETLPHAMGERGRLSARSYDSSSPPEPADKNGYRDSGWAGEGPVRLVRERGCCKAGLLGGFLGTMAPVGAAGETRLAAPSFAFVPLAEWVRRKGGTVLT